MLFYAQGRRLAPLERTARQPPLEREDPDAQGGAERRRFSAGHTQPGREPQAALIVPRLLDDGPSAASDAASWQAKAAAAPFTFA
jgi:hypothetical protein